MLMVLKRAVILTILLHAKWSNLTNTQTKSTKFSEMLGEDEKMTREKFEKTNKERQSKLEKGYSQDLVKQTVVHMPNAI